MTVKPLSYLSDAFRWRPWTWQLLRQDEMSGAGDGRYWSAQLAPPLWVATITPYTLRYDEAERIDALVRALGGSQTPFLMCSSALAYPVGDPGGTVITGSTVSISAIATDRTAVTFSGMPSGYELRVGDKFSISYDGGVYFAQVSEDGAASGAGTLTSDVFPYVPLDLETGETAVFAKPACPVVLDIDRYEPAVITGQRATGPTLRIVQKKRVTL